MLTLNSKIHLSNLANNRHALNRLASDEFELLRHDLLDCLQVDIDTQAWYLIGTDGCHLCQDASVWINFVLQTQANAPILHQLEIMDTTDISLLDTMGKYLPILITPNKLLCYPFSMMDVQLLITDE